MNVLVNENKKKRAEDILLILDGKKPKELQASEITPLKAKFTELVKEEKVEKKDMLEFVYTTLGGLVRTEEEHKKAEVARKTTKKAYDKKKKDAEAKKEQDD